MLKALVLKELRETAWIALVGLVAQLAFVGNAAGYAVVPFWASRSYGGIPFLDGSFLTTFLFLSVALAIALGMRQTAVESGRGTWLFLLHRPTSIRVVLGAKLGVGIVLYLLCGLIAILVYAAWAATPGNHASPFFWWMTADAWVCWAAISMVYPAAFLAGTRPARWFGTRLLPLVGAGFLAVLPGVAMKFHWLLGVAVLLVLGACLVGLILFAARTRDYS